MSCCDLDIAKPFNGYCFGHVLSVFQYATSDDKVVRVFHYASIKTAQANVQKCITCLRKFDKGKQPWEKVCVDSSFSPLKLNTFMKMRYVKIFHPFVFFPHVGFLLLLFSFGFLPMPHSLLVQMNFFTHANFFLG